MTITEYYRTVVWLVWLATLKFPVVVVCNPCRSMHDTPHDHAVTFKWRHRKIDRKSKLRQQVYRKWSTEWVPKRFTSITCSLHSQVNNAIYNVLGLSSQYWFRRKCMLEHSEVSQEKSLDPFCFCVILTDFCHSCRVSRERLAEM